MTRRDDSEPGVGTKIIGGERHFSKNSHREIERRSRGKRRPSVEAIERWRVLRCLPEFRKIWGGEDEKDHGSLRKKKKEGN